LPGQANGVSFPAVLLRGFPASPFVRKARLLLRFKGASFDEEPARLFQGATLSHFVEALEQPTLVDGDAAIHGTTAIAEYLDQSHPDRPLYPAPPLGARARIIEQWVDRVLVPATLGVRWLLRTNFSRSWQELAASYGHAAGADLLAPALRPVFREFVALRVEGAPSFFGRDAARLNRLAVACEALDGALAETGWLGPSPTAADLAAYAGLEGLEEMDGWETVRAGKRIAAWMQGVARALETGETPADVDVIDVADAQAFVETRTPSQRRRA